MVAWYFLHLRRLELLDREIESRQRISWRFLKEMKILTDRTFFGGTQIFIFAAACYWRPSRPSVLAPKFRASEAADQPVWAPKFRASEADQPVWEPKFRASEAAV
jgi:hypothetical protein